MQLNARQLGILRTTTPVKVGLGRPPRGPRKCPAPQDPSPNRTHRGRHSEHRPWNLMTGSGVSRASGIGWWFDSREALRNPLLGIRGPGDLLGHPSIVASSERPCRPQPITSPRPLESPLHWGQALHWGYALHWGHALKGGQVWSWSHLPGLVSEGVWEHLCPENLRGSGWEEGARPPALPKATRRLGPVFSRTDHLGWSRCPRSELCGGSRPRVSSVFPQAPLGAGQAW